MRLIAIPSAGCLLLVSLSAAEARRHFDGSWSVEVVTEQGSCDRAYRFPIIIKNGQVRYGGGEAINVTGTVSAGGMIRSSIGAQGLRANVAGRLAGAFGSGTWTLSGNRTCSGSWNAERRSGSST